MVNDRESFRRTRIVATVGPSCSSREMIEKLLDAGVNVFRMNFSHGTQEGHKANYAIIRECSQRMNRPIGILQDLQGPKIRITNFQDGSIRLERGDEFVLRCSDTGLGNSKWVGVTYAGLCNDLSAGDVLLLDDGRLSLDVQRVEGTEIHTRVILGGKLSNRKGLNIPSAHLSLPALTEKDISDVHFGAALGVDWVAISFVRTGADVQLARTHMVAANSTAKLMAKIEKPSAVDDIASILEYADGIMVARGDLGVESSPERVPALQKMLIRRSREAGIPVVTATQMLESMIENPGPTRAEASDVANAIYDGTDAIMLSAETAAGQYPVEAVEMMARIAESVEGEAEYQHLLRKKHPMPADTVADAVSLSACEIAHHLSARVIVCFSASGATALRVSRNRYSTPIVAITTSKNAFHQLSMSWGVRAILSDDVADSDDMVKVANRAIQATGLARAGDRYVITAGVPFGVKGTTNLIRVEKCEA